MNLIQKLATRAGLAIVKSVGIEVGRGWYPIGGAANDGLFITRGWAKGGDPMTDRATQMQQLKSWVYVCANMNASEIAKTPRKFWKMTGNKRDDWTETKMPPELARALHISGGVRNLRDPFANEASYWKRCALSLELSGEAPVFIDTANGAGRILVGLIPLRADAIAPDVSPDGEMRGFMTARQVVLPIDKVLMTLYPNPLDAFRGLSPVQAMAGAIDLNSEIRRYSAALTKNYGMPAITLTPKTPLTQPQVEQLKAWSLENKGKVGDERLYPYGLEVISHGVNPRDLDFVNGHRITKEEILAGCGIPEILITGKDANRSTIEVATQNWLDTTVFPRMDVLEEAFNTQVVHRFFGDEYWYGFERRVVQFSEDRSRKEALALQHNLITVEEWRAEDGRPEKRPAGTDPSPATVFSFTPPAKEPDEVWEQPEPPAKSISKAWKTVEDRAWLWKSFDGQLRAVERPFAKGVYRQFGRQSERTAAAIREAAKNGGSIPDTVFDPTAAERDLTTVMTEYVENAALAGRARAAALTQRDVPEGEQVIRRYSVPFVRDSAALVTAETAKRIKGYCDTHKIGDAKDVVEMLAVDLSTFLSDIDALIRDSARSVTIAETMSVSAVNYGVTSGFRDVGVEKKEWLSQMDGNVRGNDPNDHYDHRLDGTIIGLSERFQTSPSSSLEYPGDPMGDAGDIINCRCTLLPVLEEA